MKGVLELMCQTGRLSYSWINPVSISVEFLLQYFKHFTESPETHVGAYYIFGTSSKLDDT